MDWGSLAGIALALAGILLGQAMEGGNIASLLQPAAFVIVAFGTFGAVLLQTRAAIFWRGIKLLRWILIPPVDDRHALVERINTWSAIAKRDGILRLENQLNEESHPFIRKAMRLLVDGTPPPKIREICAIELEHFEAMQRDAARIWNAAGGYAPTVGILGAVLGLIHVMENLSDPELLGSGIAVAFVATIYGVGLANLVFLPIYQKLKNLIDMDIERRELVLGAIIAIGNGEHPRLIEERTHRHLE
jgi:chemotaxis protein MotA